MTNQDRYFPRSKWPIAVEEYLEKSADLDLRQSDDVGFRQSADLPHQAQGYFLNLQSQLIPKDYNKAPGKKLFYFQKSMDFLFPNSFHFFIF